MSPLELAATLRAMAEDDTLMTAAHLTVEDELIDRRDSRVFVIHANGLVIRESDGRPSEVIRMGTREGIIASLNAIAAELEKP